MMIGIRSLPAECKLRFVGASVKDGEEIEGTIIEDENENVHKRTAADFRACATGNRQEDGLTFERIIFQSSGPWNGQLLFTDPREWPSLRLHRR